MVTDGLADIADTAGQRFVSNRHIGPNGRHQFIPGDGLVGMLGKVSQDLEALRRQPDFASAPERQRRSKSSVKD